MENHEVDDPTVFDSPTQEEEEDGLPRQIANTNGHQGGAVQSEQLTLSPTDVLLSCNGYGLVLIVFPYPSGWAWAC